ncbi:MAG: 7-cyano-7-deazaguanine synthase QueC [Chloroflexi bacterium]|nr:7-cyano-7-deazaguanine synthase QueC [Chloroflexota bacterium]
MSSARAVVLLSGGLDSTTVTAVAKNQGYELYALSFDYSQRHGRELEAARMVAQYFGCAQWHVIPLSLSLWGGSALTMDAEVPKGRSLEEMESAIPATYVPARNTLFIAYGLAYAEAIDAEAIFVGVNAVDYSGYPDCRPEYVAKYRELIDLATKKTVEGGRIELKTPLIHLTKAEIIRLGMENGAPYHLTWSCYEGGEKACGQCDSCQLRLRGFQEAGLADPIAYTEPYLR